MSAHTPRLTLGNDWQLRLTAVIAVVGLAALAPYAPKDALLAVPAAALVVLVFRRLALGLAIFVVVTFPEHLPGSLSAGATVAKPLGIVVAASWLAYAVAKHGELRLLPRDHPALSWAVVGFVSLAASSLLWATDLAQTEYEVKRLLQVAILMFVVYTVAATSSTFRAIVWAYMAGSVITATYSVVTGSYAGGRLAGLFDPNIFAAELIPAISVAAFLLLTPRRFRMRVLAAGVLAVDLLAFALTQSRGGLVGLGVALVAAIVLAGRARPRLIVAVVLLIAVGVGYYVEYAPAQVKARFTNVSGKGTSGRSDEWQIAVRMFRDHPVIGVGLGNYTTVEPRYATASINLQIVNFVVVDRLVAHNTYLEIAAELGIVGVSLLLFIFGCTLVKATRALARFEAERDDVEFYARGLIVGTIGMLTAYFFLSAEYEKQLWLVLGLLASLPTLITAARQSAQVE